MACFSPVRFGVICKVGASFFTSLVRRFQVLIVLSPVVQSPVSVNPGLTP